MDEEPNKEFLNEGDHKNIDGDEFWEEINFKWWIGDFWVSLLLF